MPEFTSYPAGTPSWVDLASSDLDSSQKFYTSLFGWDAESQGEESGGYVMFQKNGKAVAGAMTIMMEGQPPSWTTYISTDNADATVDAAKDAGATVFVEPMDVLDVGRMAVFADPTGAVIGLWQAGNFKGAELANEPGSFCWNELQTRDTAAAKAFYSKVFGWEPNTADMDGMTYTEWKMGDRSLGGMMEMSPDMPPQVPAFWLVYFSVDDCDATVAQANGLGATTMAPPMDIPPGRFAVLADANGASFGVIKTNPMGS
jgi:predicted enzyme related to lactoylglutathione lyase